MWRPLTVVTLLACQSDLGPSLLEPAETGEVEEDTGLVEVWEESCEPVAEALAADLEASGAMGASVAVYAEGELSCAFGLGKRSPDDERGVDGETLFRIGPLTKVLTAIAVLQRGQDQEDWLSSSVTEWVPEFQFALNAGWADRIVVGHTLLQTSAMVDLFEVAADPDDDVLSDWMHDTYGATRWLMAEPGAFWNPSVPGDAMAGLVLEWTAGSRYRHALRMQVLDQIGMRGTVFLGEDVAETGDAAWGWTTDWTDDSGDQRMAGPHSYDNGWARPSAYAWSNAVDLGALLGFLLDGDELVLNDEDRLNVYGRVVDTKAYLDRLHYGYGMYVLDGYQLGETWYQGTLAMQSGGLPGYTAELVLAPDAGVGVAVLVSGDDVDLDATVEAALGAWGALGEVEDAPDPEIDPADWESLTGDYRDPFTLGPLSVELEDETLSLSIPMLDSFGPTYQAELDPVSRDNFLLTLDGETMLLTFLRGDDGRGETIRARPFVAFREESAALPLPPAAPLPSPPAPGPDPFLRVLRRAGLNTPSSCR